MNTSCEKNDVPPTEPSDEFFVNQLVHVDTFDEKLGSIRGYAIVKDIRGDFLVISLEGHGAGYISKSDVRPVNPPKYSEVIRADPPPPPPPPPVCLPLRAEYDRHGGYASMFGGFVIYDGSGMRIMVVDCHHFGQRSCDDVKTGEEAWFTRAMAFAQWIVAAANKTDPVVPVGVKEAIYDAQTEEKWE